MHTPIALSSNELPLVGASRSAEIRTLGSIESPMERGGAAMVDVDIMHDRA